MSSISADSDTQIPSLLEFLQIHRAKLDSRATPPSQDNNNFYTFSASVKLSRPSHSEESVHLKYVDRFATSEHGSSDSPDTASAPENRDISSLEPISSDSMFPAKCLVRMVRQLGHRGFHRDLITGLNFTHACCDPCLGNTGDKDRRCVISLEEHLTESIYVDIYQLREMELFARGPSVQVLSRELSY